MEVGPTQSAEQDDVLTKTSRAAAAAAATGGAVVSQPRSRIRRALPSLVALVVGTILSVTLFFEARSLDYQRVQLEFDNLGEEIKTVLESRLVSSLDVLRSMSALYAASNEVDRDEFARFTRSSLQHNGGIRGLAWAPRVRPDQIAAHEELVVRQLKVKSGYHVRLPVEPGGADLYPLTFVEPAERFEPLLGTNLTDYKPFRSVITRAIEGAKLLGSDPVELEDPQERFECLVFLPIYRDDATPDTAEKRRAEVQGITVAILNVRELLESALQVINLHGQDIRLVDQTHTAHRGQPIDPAMEEEITGTRTLYESRPDLPSADEAAAQTSLRPWEQRFDLAGRQWLLQGIPNSTYLSNQRRSSPWGALAAGLLVTLLVSAYIQAMAVRAARIRELVDVRTAKLAWANEMLEAEVHDRRVMHDALRQSEERNRAVVQQASEGIYLVDVQSHKIVEANPAMHRLLGYQPGELKGKLVYDCVGDTRENVDERMKRVVASVRPLIGERQYRRRDSSLVDISASASVITYGGRQVVCTVVHDISERKRAQQLLEHKNRQLEEAFEAERQALDAMKSAQSQLVQAEKMAGLGQMVAGVAHEINNPLSFVANNVAVLQRDLAAIKQLLETYRKADDVLAREAADVLQSVRELADQIDLDYTLGNLDELLVRSREGLRRIQQIVKDLRDFARLDEGELKEADLNTGIETTANIILGRAKKRQVQLELKLGELPLVTCYPAKVNQVVMNLMSNAIDASPTNEKVTVTTRAVDGGVEIEVSDRGSGVPPEIRARIFDPFFTTKPIGEGTGLGLSISYGIIKEHGGRIDLDSEPGQGTRFVVFLPLVPPPSNKRKTPT